MAGDQYRIMAAELQAKAANERNEMIAAEWNNLARAYLKLAEHADKNSYRPHPNLDRERDVTT
jgi:hypothetical protein